MKEKRLNIALLLLMAIMTGCHKSNNTLTVSAAADLTDAFTEIGQEFKTSSGIEINFNFGSTGQLAFQIEQGAPVDLFAAAGLSYIVDLEQKGILLPESRLVYGTGRLVIWSQGGSAPRVDNLAGLKTGEVKRIAIANPDHAPYGVAAREALQSAGLWSDLQPKLVQVSNVREALRYAATGEVDVALVALSLCQAGRENGTSSGNCTLVPKQLHRPLIQAMGIVAKTKNRQAAEQFVGFVKGERGSAILSRYGFVDPGAEN